MKFFASILGLLTILTVAHAQPVIQTTPFTRTLLKAPDSATALTAIGGVGAATATNLVNTIASNVAPPIVTNLVAASAAAQAATNSSKLDSLFQSPGNFHRFWSRLYNHTNLNIVVLGDSVGTFPAQVIHEALEPWLSRNGSFAFDTIAAGGNYAHLDNGYVTGGTTVTGNSLFIRNVTESGAGADNDFWFAHNHLFGAGGTNSYTALISDANGSQTLHGNRITVAYGGDAFGTGSFKIQTSTSYVGSWTDRATISTAASVALLTTNVSLATGDYVVRCLNVSGTNSIYSLGLISTNSTNSYTLTMAASPGIEQFNNEYLAGQASVTNWWHAIDPDLVIVSQKKSTNWMYDSTTALNPVFGWISNTCPLASWVFALPSPDFGSGAGGPTERAVERSRLRGWCDTNGIPYYDTTIFSGTLTNFVSLGYTTASDAVHASTIGYTYEFRMLPLLLGIDVSSMYMLGYSNLLTGGSTAVDLSFTNSLATTNALATLSNAVPKLATDNALTGNQTVTGNKAVDITGYVTVRGSKPYGTYNWWMPAGGIQMVMDSADNSTYWDIRSSAFGSYGTKILMLTNGSPVVFASEIPWSVGTVGIVPTMLAASNLFAPKQLVAPSSLRAGATLWSDGTNLCVVIDNGSTKSTNKVTLTTWP